MVLENQKCLKNDVLQGGEALVLENKKKFEKIDVLQGGEAFRDSAVQEAVWGVVKDAWPGEEALTGYELLLLLL